MKSLVLYHRRALLLRFGGPPDAAPEDVSHVRGRHRGDADAHAFLIHLHQHRGVVGRRWTRRRRFSRRGNGVAFSQNLRDAPHAAAEALAEKFRDPVCRK